MADVEEGWCNDYRWTFNKQLHVYKKFLYPTMICNIKTLWCICSCTIGEEQV